jgi:hypothetical protein
MTQGEPGRSQAGLDLLTGRLLPAIDPLLA